MAELVARWVRFYTRGLPAEIGQRRVDEVDADLHDHIAHERANGIGERRIARAVASRMVRGLAADAAWRRHQAKRAAQSSTGEDTVRKTYYRSAVRVALGVAVVETILVLTNVLGWFWVLGIAAVVFASWYVVRRRTRNEFLRRVTSTAALSQVLPLLLPLLIGIVALTVTVVVVVLIIVLIVAAFVAFAGRR